VYIRGVEGVLQKMLYSYITPRQKVFKRCRLKVYFQRQDSTGYTAIGQSGRSQLFSLRYFFLQRSVSFISDSTGRKLKWLLKRYQRLRLMTFIYFMQLSC